MSLIKKRPMTEKQPAAVRQNQKLSHGPATDEGRERIRAAHLRHGFYARAEEVAMRAVGEDPARYQELVEGFWETYQPADAVQEGLVIRLARCTWLQERADRMQEGYAVRLAQEVNVGREDRLHVRMIRLKMTVERLRRLVESVAREHYVTTPADLEKMKNLHQEGELKDMGEIALALFYQLQPPGTGEDGVDPNEMSRRALIEIKEIFGLNSDHPPRPRVGPYSGQPEESSPNTQSGAAPGFSSTQRNHSPHAAQAPEAGAPQAAENDKLYPNITPSEWEARERPRQLLENILTRQAEICEAQRKAVLKESLASPSPYERAAEIAPTHPNALLMRRMQESYFREIQRITNLLLKLKRYARKMEAFKKAAVGNEPAENHELRISSEYVDDNKGS
jgi:hypothetical protein